MVVPFLLIGFCLLTQVSGMAASSIREPHLEDDEQATDDDTLRQDLVAPPNLPCWYGQNMHEHGEVVAVIPSVCLQLICYHGIIVPVFVGNMFGEVCCEFGGQLYTDGSVLPNQCIDLHCYHGTWHTSGYIQECCRHCLVHNDPHWNTFDGFQYDFHGICNYSIAQSDFTHDPDIGVFSDFVPCNLFASCLNKRTFRNDPHTVITFDNLVTGLYANGYYNAVPLSGISSVMKSPTISAPVLMWSDSAYCTFLAGSSGLLLRHCPWRLDVWAHPLHTGKLDGLCGHFNYHYPDDFTSRPGVIYPLSFWPPWQFPRSWLTDVQANPTCYRLGNQYLEWSTNPCTLDDQSLADIRDICNDTMDKALRELQAMGLPMQDLDPTHNCIETCVLDLCMMRQDGATRDQENRWLETLKIIKMLSFVTDWKGIAGPAVKKNHDKISHRAEGYSKKLHFEKSVRQNQTTKRELTDDKE